jgi:hypothetical protein
MERATVRTGSFPALLPRGSVVQVVGRGVVNANNAPSVHVAVPGPTGREVLVLYRDEVEFTS